MPLVRRVLGSLALAFVVDCGVALINEEVAGFLFIPSWIAVFLAWPYVRQKLNTNPFATLKSRRTRPAIRGRIMIPGLAALALAYEVAAYIDVRFFGPILLVCWIALSCAWPSVIRRVPYLNFSKTIAPPSPAVQRPLWRRMVRETAVFVGGTGLALFFMSLIVVVPISLSFARAKKVHNSIHVGMTVQEVLRTAKDCDVFSASSEFPHDDDSDPDHIPVVTLSWGRDSTYRLADASAHQDVRLSESEAVDRLGAMLHQGYRWVFRYTYINLTPMHVTFSVEFGPDGRVCEVKPIYGWD